MARKTRLSSILVFGVVAASWLGAWAVGPRGPHSGVDADNSATGNRNPSRAVSARPFRGDTPRLGILGDTPRLAVTGDTPQSAMRSGMPELEIQEGRRDGARLVRTVHGSRELQLCQALGPAAPCPVSAVDGSCCVGGRGCRGWECARTWQWQQYAQGEYVGHARTPHVPEYRLRVDDLLDLVYRRTREKQPTPYQLNVGDEIRVESFTDAELNRDLIVQPDGTITLRLLGQVQAVDLTVPQLREKLEELYQKYYKAPAITVTPLVVNSKLNDLVYSVDARYGQGGLARNARVTPEGTIALPVLGSVFVQGLSLSELQEELNERYREHVEGIQVIPVLIQRAPRYVYVLGEVRSPGRYELTGPTTAMQAISMAGSWNVGAYLKHVVVFRRGDDWRLLATLIDLQAAVMGNQPCPAGEIWLSDSDIVLVPKSPILRADDFIDLVFTRGIYGVFPVSTSINFSKLSSL